LSAYPNPLPRTNNNPVLIGEPGSAKTAIIEGLAQRIVTVKSPQFSLTTNRRSDLSLIVAGTNNRGQFEDGLKTIMRELLKPASCFH